MPAVRTASLTFSDFETPPFAGHGGTYEIRAIWTNSHGELMDQIQEIEVGPGVEMLVDFTDDSQ